MKHKEVGGVLMSPPFWTNTIWYVLLGISTLFELIFIIVKTERRSNAVAFYLTILGITLNFEMIILIYLKAYSYYPMILKNPPIPFDNVLAGNLFSQFSVSATILLVVVLNLKYYWLIIFAVMYGIIEELFLFLGIYSHNWYETWITVVMLYLAFLMAKRMYVKITQDIKPIFHYGNILMALFPLFIILLQWPLQLFRLQEFSKSLFLDPIISRHFLALVHFLVLMVFMMFIYFSRVSRILKLIVLVMLYAIYFIGYKFNLVLIKPSCFLPIATLSILWMYLSIFIMDRLYGEPLKNRITGIASILPE